MNDNKTITSILDDSLFIGEISKVKGNYCEVAVSKSTTTRKFTFHGDRYNLSLVKSFVLVVSNFSYFLARINSIEVPDKDRFNLSRQSSDSTQQLLKCILITELDPITFTPEKELLSYPIIRSKVYVADKRIINKFTENLEFTRNSGARTQHLGNMVESGAPINVSFQSLFERHLAIVGSTGSGKSNTAGRLIEELSYSGQRSIIIDPTGEYSNIVDSFNNAIKLTIGEDAFVPVHLLSKLDLVNIFLPSERAQLPKLMAAINSLKTVKALQNDSTVSNLKEFQQYGFSTGELIRTNKDFEPLKVTKPAITLKTCRLILHNFQSKFKMNAIMSQLFKDRTPQNRLNLVVLIKLLMQTVAP